MATAPPWLLGLICASNEVIYAVEGCGGSPIIGTSSSSARPGPIMLESIDPVGGRRRSTSWWTACRLDDRCRSEKGSDTGNRTPVISVTGRYTNHYTMSEVI